MAQLKNLTGQRFGKLVVLERAGSIHWGKLMAAWKCRCDCGRVEVLPHNRLPHRESIPRSHRVTACDVCRRPRCVECGEPLPASRSKTAKTCGEACHQLRTRARQLEHYYRRVESDTEYNHRRNEKVRHRRAADPAYADLLRAQARRNKGARRVRMTEDELARLRASSRDIYRQQWRDVHRRRRDRYNALSHEERAMVDERNRESQRRYRARFRRWLDSHPEEKRRYRERYREWLREREIRLLRRALDDHARESNDDK